MCSDDTLHLFHSLRFTGCPGFAPSGVIYHRRQGDPTRATRSGRSVRGTGRETNDPFRPKPTISPFKRKETRERVVVIHQVGVSYVSFKRVESTFPLGPPPPVTSRRRDTNGPIRDLSLGGDTGPNKETFSGSSGVRTFNK